MALPLIATCFAVLGGLLYAIPVLISAGFLAKVPSGENAVALVVPFFSSILAGICLLLANFCLVAAGKWDELPKPGWITSGTIFLLGLAAFGAFFAWLEHFPAWTKPLSLFCGALMPLATAGFMVYAAFHQPQENQTALTLLRIPILIASFMGLLFAVWGVQSYLSRVRANEKREWEAYQAREKENARVAALSPLERLEEKYASFSPNSPLWPYLVDLVLESDPACRALTVSRCLSVPNWSDQLKSCLQSDTPLYQRGALQLVNQLASEQLQADWAESIAQSVRITQAQMAKDDNWLTTPQDLNPKPLAHVQDLLAAAQRFNPNPGMESALQSLQIQLESQAESPEQQAAKLALAAVLGQPRERH
ncbi:MAG: hypothetical protein H6510_05175 [Acidobacteria bacterium]|nr:hypothetical protein [Acidobacteriota bacterium]MCB9397186.1 hypothetical protein [Acidobacteriota bacterium]